MIGVALSYQMHPFRPRVSVAGWRELMRFSSWVLLSNIFIFAGNRGYDFVIGRIGGTSALGLYSVAYEIANLPTTEIVWPASRVIFPGFSKLAGDMEKLREAFLHTAALVAVFTIPAGAGVAVLAEQLVRILLGEKWLAAVPLIQLLAVFGVLRALHAGIGSVYLALGMTRITAVLAIPHLAVGLPVAAFLLARYNIEAAVLGILGAGLIAVVMNFTIAQRILTLRSSELGACFWRPALAAAGMVLVEIGFLRATSAAGNIFELTLWTLLLIAVGAVVYVAILLLLWRWAGRPRGAERILLDQLTAVVRTRQAAS
jgi:O-antigen/teichoic acid export membrane protein